MKSVAKGHCRTSERCTVIQIIFQETQSVTSSRQIHTVKKWDLWQQVLAMMGVPYIIYSHVRLNTKFGQNCAVFIPLMLFKMMLPEFFQVHQLQLEMAKLMVLCMFHQSETKIINLYAFKLHYFIHLQCNMFRGKISDLNSTNLYCPNTVIWNSSVCTSA